MIALVIICLCFNVAMFIVLGLICISCMVSAREDKGKRVQQLKQWEAFNKIYTEDIKSFIKKYDIKHQNKTYEVSGLQLVNGSIYIHLTNNEGFNKTVGLDDVVLIEKQ